MCHMHHVSKRHFFDTCACKFVNCRHVFHVHSVMYMLCVNVLIRKMCIAVAEFTDKWLTSCEREGR